MNRKRWHRAAILAMASLAFFTAAVMAEEVGAETAVEKETMFSLIKKGGPIMIPLGIASILALALAMERFIALRKDRVLPAGFIESLMVAWGKDPSGKQAVAYCDESGGAVGHIFKAGIRRAKMGHEAVEKAIEDAGSREADKMKRSLRPLSVIATISPLLGLLGTVYGMIDAFQKTSSSGGTAKTAMLATGIYEALVTTAAGLTIAIPVLLMYQFLLGRVDKLIDEIDEAGTEFVFSYTEGDTTAVADSGGTGGGSRSGGEDPLPPSAAVAAAGA
ncbi:MAG: MotA/TolQ/ExbB proton channel family protein [Phycisphaeraceae bacterium]|nr:MotA/TolQ/ExbB proton channel family protein [Phycisphaeraceae bacterium]